VVVAVALLCILVDDRLPEGYGVAYRLNIAYGDPLFRSGGYDTPKLVRKICEVKGLAEEMAYWWCLHYATVGNHLRAICATQSHFDVCLGASRKISWIGEPGRVASRRIASMLPFARINSGESDSG
jgi:hypothetical protein